MKKLFAFLALLLIANPAFAAFNMSGYTVPLTGAPAPYWVIQQITLNPIKSTCNVQVGEYVSSADYIANLKPVATQNFLISGSTYSAFLAAVTSADLPSGTTEGAVLTQLIGALQTNMLTLPAFSGATIVP